MIEMPERPNWDLLFRAEPETKSDEKNNYSSLCKDYYPIIITDNLIQMNKKNKKNSKQVKKRKIYS